MELIERVRALVAQIQHEHAPDPRLAVYEVAVLEDGDALRVVGVVSEPSALEALRRRIGTLDGGGALRDELARLPEDGTGERAHAIVSSAVAPLLSGPMVSEPHLSQAVLGQHLVVLRQRGRWLQVRAEDGYLGWVHRGYVHRVDEPTARGWLLGSDAQVYLSLGAELRDGEGEILARLPWGARFHSDGATGALPTGATGRVVGDAIPASLRRERFPAERAALVATALEWLGTPYVWSGITPAGADCSGFVQSVYRMHGVDLPRDSDQQALVGVRVDPHPDLSNLLPGDLLFFAEEPHRVSHVAISLGGSRLVHSSLGNGGVRRNDLAGGTPLEDELRRLLVGVRRVVE